MIGQHIKLAGAFAYEVHNAGTLREEGFIDNMLLDPFFFTWLAGSTAAFNFFSHCGLGTDTATVLPGDTSITPTVDARVPSSGVEPVLYPALGQWRTGKRYTFPIRTTSQTVNKLGIYSALTGGTLSAAALLGSPLNLISGDILTVKHYITATLDLTDRTGTLVLDGVNCAYTMRWFNLDASFDNAFLLTTPWNLHNVGWATDSRLFGYSSNLSMFQNQTLITNTQDRNNIPVTAGDGPSAACTVTQLAYVPSTYYRDVEWVMPYNQGNTPLGAGNIMFSLSSAFASELGFVLNFAVNRVPKLSAATHEFRFTLRFTWGR